MWTYFQAGGPLMWPLLLCSIVAVALILERFWFWKLFNLKKEEAACQEMIETGKMPADKQGGALTTLVRTGLTAPARESDKAMEVIALESLGRMRRGMTLLDTIITASPMLGIMGTVLGIITSFDMLGAAGVSEPKAVIAGIAQALITTVTGLGIAVICIFPYNYFNARIDVAQDLLESWADRVSVARNGETSRANEG